MTCPTYEDLIESVLSGQSAVESHLASCSQCAGRLAAVEMLDGLLEGEFADQGGVSCPDPEDLASWAEGSRIGCGDQVDLHLAVCRSCRLAVLAVSDAGVESSARVRPVARPSPVTRHLRQRQAAPVMILRLLALAASVLALLGVSWLVERQTEEQPLVSRREQASPETEALPLAAERPALEQPIASTEPSPVAGDQALPSTDQGHSEELAPAPSVERVPSVDPVVADSREVGPAEPAPGGDELESAEPASPGRDSDEPAVVAGAGPGSTVLALAITDATGIRVRSADSGGWRDLRGGDELRSGDALRASNAGGVLRVPAGAVYLSPRARSGFSGDLRLESGQAFVEGPGRLTIETPFCAVEVQRSALLEVRRGRAGVLAVDGPARCLARNGESVTVQPRELLTAKVDDLGRPRPASGFELPEWLGVLRPEDPERNRPPQGRPRPPRPGPPQGPPPPGPPGGRRPPPNGAPSGGPQHPGPQGGGQRPGAPPPGPPGGRPPPPNGAPHGGPQHPGPQGGGMKAGASSPGH